MGVNGQIESLVPIFPSPCITECRRYWPEAIPDMAMTVRRAMSIKGTLAIFVRLTRSSERFRSSWLGSVYENGLGNKKFIFGGWYD